MSAQTGTPALHEAGDQRNVPQSDIEQEKKENRFHEGKENSHKADDPKDERSIANRLEREAKRETEKEQDTPEVAALKKDPTAPARMHGNEPSKGAKIDAEIQAEEEEELRRKGKA